MSPTPLVTGEAEAIWRHWTTLEAPRPGVGEPAPGVVTTNTEPSWDATCSFILDVTRLTLNTAVCQQNVNQGDSISESSVTSDSVPVVTSSLVTVAFINPQFWFSNKGRGLYTHNIYCKFTSFSNIFIKAGCFFIIKNHSLEFFNLRFYYSMYFMHRQICIIQNIENHKMYRVFYIIKREIHTIHIQDDEDVTLLYELLLWIMSCFTRRGLRLQVLVLDESLKSRPVLSLGQLAPAALALSEF